MPSLDPSLPGEQAKYSTLSENSATLDKDNIFRHENESVDLLLKEMHKDPANLSMEESDSRNNSGSIQPLSSANSPTKPLNFPQMQPQSRNPRRSSNQQQSQHHQNLVTSFAPEKEFNSSSDTYTSELESPKDGVAISGDANYTSSNNLHDERTHSTNNNNADNGYDVNRTTPSENNHNTNNDTKDNNDETINKSKNTQTSDQKHDTSFGRNFSFEEDTNSVQKTIEKKIVIDNEEFSFVTTKKEPQLEVTHPIEADPITDSSAKSEVSEAQTINEPKVTHSPNTSNTNSDPNPITPSTSTYFNSSPSKSIMKKASATTPRKNVAFTNGNPEVHRYKANQDSSANTSTNQSSSLDEDEPSALRSGPRNHTLYHQQQDQETEEIPDDTKRNSLSHSWNELSKSNSSSDNESSSTPPAPPPHTSDSIHSFTNLLLDTRDKHHKEEDDLDRDTLNHMKQQKRKSFTNLSLNEKLDIYLASKLKSGQTIHNKDNTDADRSRNSQELDEHLANLNRAVKYQTDSNIHHLSLDLQQHAVTEIENPLNSLTKNSDFQVRSGGSSQSSLQSLAADNRTLRSYNEQHASRQGIELNDGIKGFPDHLVQSLIPSTRRSEMDDIESGETAETGEVKREIKAEHAPLKLPMSQGLESDDEYHDSFDNSYNTAEKSIMNLLNRTDPSQEHRSSLKKEALENPFLSEKGKKVGTKNIESPRPGSDFLNEIKSEKDTSQYDTPPLKNEANSNDFSDHTSANLSHHHIFIKSEPKQKDSFVKSEPPSFNFVKSEPVANIKSESSHEDARIKLEPREGQSRIRDFENYIKSEPTENITMESGSSDSSFDLKEEPNHCLSVKQEPSEVISVKSELQEPVYIKSESDDTSLKSETFDPISVKSERVQDIFDPVSVKSERSQNIFDAIEDKGSPYNNGVTHDWQHSDHGEDTHDHSFRSEHEDDHLDYDPNTQLESASYGVSLDPKDIRLISPDKSISRNNRAIDMSEGSYSHDGDREDNDVPTDHELPTLHHHAQEPQFREQPDESPYSMNDYQDASEEIEKSLAPPRVDEAVDATSPPSPIKRALLQKQPGSKQQFHKEINVNESLEEDDALANSSNVAPPENISLPMIETSKFSSFEDLTKNIDQGDSFEASLSAEHEADPNPTDFISIWHSQRKNVPARADVKERFRAPEVPEYHSSEPQGEKFRLPASLQPKKFKEVNVMSRRVVSPDFEDLHVSGFLPEISEDSGFSTHFKNLIKNGDASMNLSHLSSVSGDRKSMTPLSTRNVLSNMDNDPTLMEPPAPKPQLRPRSRLSSALNFTVNSRHSQGDIRGLGITSETNSQPNRNQRSRFTVPSFEIKRSNSILSPRNQYNDIFDDTLKRAPTIRAQGMKTLPSMDRDDVKKILEAKRAISQEEYSRVKYLGSSKKGSIVDEPTDKYDSLQQHASIYDVSSDSSPQIPEGRHMPHIATELMKNPTALLSNGYVFNDAHAQVHDSALECNNSQEVPDLNISAFKDRPLSNDAEPVAQNRGQTSQYQSNIKNSKFPDPDPEFSTSPLKDSTNVGLRTPPKATENIPEKDSIADERSAALDNDLEMKYKIINRSPRKSKSSAIKIGSPIKLVKNGSSVTGIAIDSPSRDKSKVRKNSNPFRGDELAIPKNKEQSTISKDEDRTKPATVSIPSSSTTSNASSATLSNKNKTHQYREVANGSAAAKPSPIPEEPPQERGRLFLRVIGLKNIELPDVESHKADFSISLDNGVHCIKTPNYKLNSHNVAIGKEFELTVGETLEFILTMKANYEKPRGRLVEVKERKLVKSKNRLSRMFGSKDLITTTKFVSQAANDSWANRIAQDGSFARCYVDLDQYENQITGRACSFNITCFNEWETTINHTTQQKAKVKPYRIGQLEVKMMFIPRSDSHEILPTSIKSAYEGINELRQEFDFIHEGYMHQEGGDCEIWKRRFFKLQGTSLIAHSEYSHKTRAKINLAKVVEVIYVDKENFNKASNNYRNFSDILLMEHAFKIKFANGEIIDFGAPNKSEKDAWISILESIIYRNKFRRQPWVKLMLENDFNSGMQPKSSSMV